MCLLQFGTYGLGDAVTASPSPEVCTRCQALRLVRSSARSDSATSLRSCRCRIGPANNLRSSVLRYTSQLTLHLCNGVERYDFPFPVCIRWVAVRVPMSDMRSAAHLCRSPQR